MSTERFQRIKDLFARACDLPVEDQGAFLLRECAGDDAMRREIEALLRADRTPVPGLETPVPDRHPERIGGYRVLGVIGRGGMGVVYEAEQESPRRRVALKVMSISSPELLRRFEYEAEILGRLSHPGIAKIIEAGVENGQPFFAMELIDGVPLTQYAQAHVLSPTKRLELFATICDAVQHAHQQGVIHRDLKPGNILVEAGGAPRLLDFGVAKLAEPDAQLQTLGTRAGQLLGTLPYMSPEQFGNAASGVDVRADVYALGVIGYELIAGRTPKDFSGKSLKDALTLAHTGEVARLGTLAAGARGDVETIIGKALEQDRERRYGSAGELAADVRRYLRDEPIVARPPSASYQLRKLARRHRAVFYGAALALCAIVIGGVVSLTLFFRKEEERKNAVSARRVAEAERGKAMAARELAEARAETRDEVVGFLVSLFDVVDPAEARGRTVTAKEVLDEGAKKVLSSLDKQPEVRSQLMLYIGIIYRSLGLNDSAEPLLNEALAVRSELYGSDHVELAPVLIECARAAADRGAYDEALVLADRALATGYNPARCHYARGGIRHSAGDYRGAERDLRKALSLDDDDKMRQSLAVVLHKLGRFDEAEDLARAALELALADAGGPHPNVVARRSALAGLLSERGLYDEAEAELRKAVEEQEQLTGKDSVDVSNMANNLATVILMRGDAARAEPLLRRALEISTRWRGEQHPLTIGVMANLAQVAHRERRLEDAAAQYEAVLKAQRAISGDRHPRVIVYLTAVGGIYGELRRFKEAEAHLDDALAIARKLHGTDEHPDVVMVLGHIAGLKREQGDFEAAEKLFEQAYSIGIRIWGEGTPDAAGLLYQVGKLLQAQGRFQESVEKLSQALAIFREKFEPTSQERVGCMATLATSLIELGEFARADALLAEALAAYEKRHGPDHESVKRTLANLAMLRQRQGDYVRARPVFERLLKDPPKDPLGAAAIKNNFALVLLLLHDTRQAEKLFREARAQFLPVVGPNHPAIGTLTNNVGECLRVRGDPGERDAAEAEFRRALAIYEAAFGKENPNIANTRTKLGQLLGDRVMLEDALAMRRKLLPEGHPDIAKTLLAMGDEASLAEAVAILAAALPESPMTAEARSEWGGSLIEQGRLAEAKVQLAAAKPVLERSLGTDHPATKAALARLEKIG